MNVLILCNGRPPGAGLFSHVYDWADFFIAADGGGNVARSFNRLPDLVIGDLDSFVQRTDDPFEVVFDPGQETNDLEKALTAARNKNAGNVIVLGATGLRLDHSLKNLSVLRQFNPYFNQLIFKDEFSDIFLLPKTFTAELPVGTRISLFPLSGIVKGIRTEGLKFPLKNESLENGVRDGSSNEVAASPVKITHDEGDLICFIDRPEQP